MATYTIVPPKRPQQAGYIIQIVGEDGARHTMLGFDSEEQAEEWVAHDRQRDALQQAAD
jgi:hypothetical protein